jgi:hypothetical protein
VESVDASLTPPASDPAAVPELEIEHAIAIETIEAKNITRTVIESSSRRGLYIRLTSKHLDPCFICSGAYCLVEARRGAEGVRVTQR